MPKTIEQIEQLGEAIVAARVKYNEFEVARENFNVAIQELDMKLAAFKTSETKSPAAELPG